MDAVDELAHIAPPHPHQNVLQTVQVTHKRPLAEGPVDCTEHEECPSFLVLVQLRQPDVGAQRRGEKGQTVVTLALQVPCPLERVLDVLGTDVGPVCEQVVPRQLGDRAAALLAHCATQVLLKPLEAGVRLVPADALHGGVRRTPIIQQPRLRNPAPEAKRQTVPGFLKKGTPANAWGFHVSF